MPTGTPRGPRTHIGLISICSAFLLPNLYGLVLKVGALLTRVDDQQCGVSLSQWRQFIRVCTYVVTATNALTLRLSYSNHTCLFAQE